MLISPSGSILQTADSTDGVAVISAPVTQSGTYIVKTINLSLGPVQVWTATTPTVRRYRVTIFSEEVANTRNLF